MIIFLLFIGVMIAFSLALAFALILMPPLLIGSLVAYWYSSKKKKDKKLKKYSFIGIIVGGIGSLILIISLIFGGGSYDNEPVEKEESVKEVEGVEDIEVDNKDSNVDNENLKNNTNNKENESEIDIKEVEKLVVDGISLNDKLENISINDSNIYVKVKLDENETVDISEGEMSLGLAYIVSRYSSITDEILKNELFENITVEFVDIATVTMSRDKALQNDYGGYYFDSIEVQEIILNQIQD